MNNRTYYARMSGASQMFYMKNAAGQLKRVSVPYVSSDRGKTRWYPVVHEKTVLIPRLADGKITSYGVFENGWEVPVLAVCGKGSPQMANGYQLVQLNGRQYYAKVSGASQMFYMKNAAGQLKRVSVPYVSPDRGRTRWYPIVHGKTIVIPKLANGTVSSYVVQNGGRETAVLASVR